MDRLQSPRAAQSGDLLGAEADAAHDQPERLVLPGARGVGRLGDLRAGHVQRVGPGILGDLLKGGPHRRVARDRDAEARLVLAQPVKQIDRVVGGVDPKRHGPVAGPQHPDRARGDPRALRAGQALVIAADQLAGQRATALSPERDVRRVAHLPRPAARRAVLRAAVDGDLRRVQVDRDRRAEIAPQRPVQALPGPCHRALHALAMHPPEALADLQGGRCRGHVGDRAQRRPRRVGALVLEMIEERAADQLALREADDQLARRGAAATRLDRPRAPFQGQLAVDQPDQIQLARQIADDRQPSMRCQRPIISPNEQPSGASVTVTHAHPLGAPGSPSRVRFSHPDLDSRTGQKSPDLRGFSTSGRTARRPAGRSPDRHQPTPTH